MDTFPDRRVEDDEIAYDLGLLELNREFCEQELLRSAEDE